jgi:hypothetical protein
VLGFHPHLLTGSSSCAGDGTVVASASLGANMTNWVNALPGQQQERRRPVLERGAQRRQHRLQPVELQPGVMVGTNVLRYLVTANNTYLTQAVGGIANKSLTHYGNFGGEPPSPAACCPHTALR